MIAVYARVLKYHTRHSYNLESILRGEIEMHAYVYIYIYTWWWYFKTNIDESRVEDKFWRENVIYMRIFNDFIKKMAKSKVCWELQEHILHRWGNQSRVRLEGKASII